MENCRGALLGTLSLTLLLLGTAPAQAAEELADILQKMQLSPLVGTWVDADTKGATRTVSYAWKIQDKVLEVTNKGGSKQSVSLLAVNAKNNKVVQMGADSEGATFLGEWSLKPKQAVIGLLFTGGDGAQGALQIRQRLVDRDNMVITVDLPQPVEFRLTRKK